ncbi:hypothetical protein U9M48_018484 [Paspalum notatum var. saurae]|uniref:Uncharacterized protein n=1 Tax=Paspalum notatum var. saurae TaxID=547442 RepID=A0AAQ3WPR0_PASNO
MSAGRWLPVPIRFIRIGSAPPHWLAWLRHSGSRSRSALSSPAPASGGFRRWPRWFSHHWRSDPAVLVLYTVIRYEQPRRRPFQRAGPGRGEDESEAAAAGGSAAARLLLQPAWLSKEEVCCRSPCAAPQHHLIQHR